MTLHIQDEVLTHHRQTDKTNIRRGLHRQPDTFRQKFLKVWMTEYFQAFPERYFYSLRIAS